jgi:hypothetical protein
LRDTVALLRTQQADVDTYTLNPYTLDRGLYNLNPKP